MLVREISLVGFRNFDNVTARFADGVNVIYGSNAQGKTNLIEAIFYLAAGRSLRIASDKDLINFNSDNAFIKAIIESGNRRQTLEARICRGRRRVFIANDVKLKSASELSGRLTAVQFNPEDLNIIKDGAAIRRKLMDSCLSQLRPGYFSALGEFNKLYENKTRILRDSYEKPSLLELLDDFNQRLAEQSTKLITYRSKFVKVLSEKASEIHHKFSNGSEKMSISYKTVNNMPANDMTHDDILQEVLNHQREKYQAEIRSGLCLSGAHKDDLIIDINDVPARKFASQGQARTASVSIKLAERDIHYDDRGEYPILLLDDVLSELDSVRRGYILDRITTGQVFITCCDEEIMSRVGSNVMIRVENGRICTYISDKILL